MQITLQMNVDERPLVTFLKSFDPIVSAIKLIIIYCVEFENLLCGNFVYFSITFRWFHAVSLCVCVFNKQYSSDVQKRTFVSSVKYQSFIPLNGKRVYFFSREKTIFIAHFFSHDNIDIFFSAFRFVFPELSTQQQE